MAKESSIWSQFEFKEMIINLNGVPDLFSLSPVDQVLLRSTLASVERFIWPCLCACLSIQNALQTHKFRCTQSIHAVRSLSIGERALESDKFYTRALIDIEEILKMVEAIGRILSLYIVYTECKLDAH